MKRVLPSPDTLYDMLINQGMSYVDVSIEYGVREVNIVSTFRRDCKRRGIEWPVPRKETHSEKIAKAYDKHYMVNTFIIREVVMEYMADNDMSMKALAAKAGIDYKTISRMIRGEFDRMKKPTAIKLMKAMGEDMSESLSSWHSRSQSKEDERRAVLRKTRTTHKTDDVLDDWAFLRECGWSSAERIAGKLGLSEEALQRTLYRHRDDPRVGDLTWVFKDERDIPRGY